MLTRCGNLRQWKSWLIKRWCCEDTIRHITFIKSQQEIITFPFHSGGKETSWTGLDRGCLVYPETYFTHCSNLSEEDQVRIILSSYTHHLPHVFIEWVNEVPRRLPLFSSLTLKRHSSVNYHYPSFNLLQLICCKGCLRINWSEEHAED
jgi:hypothetical protein